MLQHRRGATPSSSDDETSSPPSPPPSSDETPSPPSPPPSSSSSSSIEETPDSAYFDATDVQDDSGPAPPPGLMRRTSSVSYLQDSWRYRVAEDNVWIKSAGILLASACVVFYAVLPILYRWSARVATSQSSGHAEYAQPFGTFTIFIVVRGVGAVLTLPFALSKHPDRLSSKALLYMIPIVVGGAVEQVSLLVCSTMLDPALIIAAFKVTSLCAAIAFSCADRGLHVKQTTAIGVTIAAVVWYGAHNTDVTDTARTPFLIVMMIGAAGGVVCDGMISSDYYGEWTGAGEHWAIALYSTESLALNGLLELGNHVATGQPLLRGLGHYTTYLIAIVTAFVYVLYFYMIQLTDSEYVFSAMTLQVVVTYLVQTLLGIGDAELSPANICCIATITIGVTATYVFNERQLRTLNEQPPEQPPLT